MTNLFTVKIGLGQLVTELRSIYLAYFYSEKHFFSFTYLFLIKQHSVLFLFLFFKCVILNIRQRWKNGKDRVQKVALPCCLVLIEPSLKSSTCAVKDEWGRKRGAQCPSFFGGHFKNCGFNPPQYSWSIRKISHSNYQWKWEIYWQRQHAAGSPYLDSLSLLYIIIQECRLNSSLLYSSALCCFPVFNRVFQRIFAFKSSLH